MSKDWSWHDEDGKESTIVPSVRAVAVYQNHSGEIVIRQEGYPEDDSVIIIPRLHIPALIDSLKKELADKV